MNDSMSNPAAALLAACACLVASSVDVPAEATSTRYTIRAGEDAHEVRFRSKAPIESFEGRTSEISGWFEMDPDDLGAGLRWKIEVGMASLDTGIGLRNRHMRENHLHTDEFPLAVFEGSELHSEPSTRLVVGKEIALEIEGELTLHGVSRTRRFVLNVLRATGGRIRAHAEFTVALSDHEIPRPKFLVMKLADEQEVSVRFSALPPGEEIED